MIQTQSNEAALYLLKMKHLREMVGLQSFIFFYSCQKKNVMDPFYIPKYTIK